ncbi:MAG: protein kinase [Polyangiaceae bacterium]
MARLPLPPPETMTLTVLAEIASGGMGSVEMARVESGRLAGQTLAIKRLHASIANDQTFVDMFLDEAWLTAAMKSPHVMGVVAHGTDERGMFLAVELIEGVPLSRLLKEARVKKETFSEQVVACIVLQICEGLLEAHGLKGSDGKPLGLVHRDLTPGNVLLAFDGTVKIVDFGIAKAEERITHTRTGTMKGKPAYMAPEQAKGSKNIDLRADLFSLGVMIYEFLAGRRPWVEKSAFDVIMAAALKPHPNILETRPGVDPVWAELIDRCLAKKASERWSSAGEIADRLKSWRTSQNFPNSDLDELRACVERFSQAQLEWFRRARAGEFAKGNAQTFKELEEAIDDARKRSGEAPYSMVPSSASLTPGRAAFDSITPARARSSPDLTPAAGRAQSQPPPGRITGAPVASVQRASGGPTLQSLTEASREAQRLGAANSGEQLARSMGGGGNLNATIALSDADLDVADEAPKSGQFGPASGVQKGLGGTEFMEVSPLKGMKLPDPRIESDSSSDLQATIRLPELSDRPIVPVESRSVIRPIGAKIAAADDAVLGATLRSDEAPAENAVSARTAEPPGARTVNTRPPGTEGAPPAEAKGLSPATVVLLILVAFIAGGAIAAWVAKTYLIQGQLPTPRILAAQQLSTTAPVLGASPRRPS